MAAKAVNRLPTVSIDSRVPLELAPVETTGEPKPIVDDKVQRVRVLARRQCQVLGSQSPPTESLLELERNILERRLESSVDLDALIALQTIHARNGAAGDALENFWKLAEVYWQHGIVDETLREIEKSEQGLSGLERAGFATGEQESELHRGRLELLSRKVELRYSQEILTLALGKYLKLDSAQNEPLWPVIGEGLDEDLGDLQSLEVEIATAMENRADLALLVRLFQVEDPELIELFRRAAANVVPWAGVGIPLNGLLLRCLSKRLKADACQELAARKSQLSSLIDQQREAVRLEVTEAWESAHRRQSVLTLKKLALNSLIASQQARDLVRDARPDVTHDQFVGARRRLELQSEIVSAAVAFEIDRVRLRRAQGLLVPMTQQ